MKKLPQKEIKSRILIVDDHPASRLGLRCMIESEPDFEVCGEAGDAASGLEAAIRLSPALVLSDVSLPGRSGFELVQDLAARCPGLPVLMVSMHSEFTHARRALEIGARGYMMKCENGETLLRAIRTVLRGRIYLGPAASSQLLEYLNKKSGRKRTGIEALSPREFEVFRLIGGGASTQAIANRLNLSMKTIDTHRDRIKRKVGADSLGMLISISSTWLSEQSMTNLPRVVT